MNIKNPAFVTALGLIALVLGLAGWYMATHPAPTPFNPSGQVGIESDTPKTMTESGQYYRIDVTYPTQISFPLSSRSDAGIQAEAAMKTWVDGAVAEFKNYAEENDAAVAEFVARGEEVPASFSSLSLDISYEKKQGPKTLTYLFTSASYTGGAHGITVPVTFTFAKATGEQLELADLFAPGTDYLGRLSQIARERLPEMMGDYANQDFIMDGTSPTADNFKTFYIEGNALVLLFAPYQVAPYVVGTVELPIPLTDLADILKPEYR